MLTSDPPTIRTSSSFLPPRIDVAAGHRPTGGVCVESAIVLRAWAAKSHRGAWRFNLPTL